MEDPPPIDFSPLDRVKPDPKPNQQDLITAKKEQNDYELDGKAQSHKRGQAAKNTIHAIIRIILCIIGAVIGIVIIVRAWHLVTPECWVWLKEEKLKSIDTLAKYAVSGALGGMLTKYLSKNMEE